MVDDEGEGKRIDESDRAIFMLHSWFLKGKKGQKKDKMFQQKD